MSRKKNKTQTRHQQQQSSAAAAAAAAAPSKESANKEGEEDSMSSSTVNGKGMWLAWTKSFKTPLLALLDLFDNAVDATMPPQSQSIDAPQQPQERRAPLGTAPFDQVEVATTVAAEGTTTTSSTSTTSTSTTESQDPRRPKIHASKDLFFHTTAATATATTTSTPGNNNNIGTAGGNMNIMNNMNNMSNIINMNNIGGIVLRNSSIHPIPPMSQVLEIYKSGKDAAAVGENGIGVKHACASLSKLSFVFSKSSSGGSSNGSSSLHYGLGVLMEGLQQEHGILLPSHQWSFQPQERQPQEHQEHQEQELQEQEQELPNWEAKIRQLAESRPNSWGVALRAFGGGGSGGSSTTTKDDHLLLDQGIQRCVSHFHEMTIGTEWKDYRNVFTVVLAELNHSQNKAARSFAAAAIADDDDNGEKDDVIGDGPIHMNNHNNQNGQKNDNNNNNGWAGTLLKELQEKLPYIYLHLHPVVDVLVDSQPIQNKAYWETKLVELSQFEVAIPETKSWRDHPHQGSSATTTTSASGWYRSRTMAKSFNTKTIRFFIGFDPYRCTAQTRTTATATTTTKKQSNPKKSKSQVAAAAIKNEEGDDDDDDDDEEYYNHEQPVDVKLFDVNDPGPGRRPNNNRQAQSSALRVYTYSRQSGRLIKIENDPRRDYGLSAGSTDFTHGLTVILDDHQATLPLNPTKQDTAFGHSEFGANHAENVHQWTSALTHFFWTYHFERFGKKKQWLRNAVAETKPRLQAMFHGENAIIPPPLCRGSFIQYPRLVVSVHCGMLRVNLATRKSIVPFIPGNQHQQHPNDTTTTTTSTLILLDTSVAQPPPRQKSEQQENETITIDIDGDEKNTTKELVAKDESEENEEGGGGGKGDDDDDDDESERSKPWLQREGEELVVTGKRKRKVTPLFSFLEEPMANNEQKKKKGEAHEKKPPEAVMLVSPTQSRANQKNHPPGAMVFVLTPDESRAVLEGKEKEWEKERKEGKEREKRQIRKIRSQKKRLVLLKAENERLVDANGSSSLQKGNKHQHHHHHTNDVGSEEQKRFKKMTDTIKRLMTENKRLKKAVEAFLGPSEYEEEESSSVKGPYDV